MTEMDAPTYFLILGLGIFETLLFSHVYTYNQKHGRVYACTQITLKEGIACHIYNNYLSKDCCSVFILSPYNTKYWDSDSGAYISPNTNVHQAVWLCRRTRPGSTSLTVAEGASVQFDSPETIYQPYFFSESIRNFFYH
jgi:hypothetical protein